MHAEKRAFMLHTQEVTGSSPVGPISRMSNLGGSKWPAFFYVHTDVHTGRRLAVAPVDPTTLRLTVAGTGFLPIAVDD